MVIPLNHLKKGQQAQIIWIASEQAQAAALQCLGFFPGQGVSCVLKGKQGEISAYLIQKNVIALRPDQACEILAKPDD